MKERLVCDAIPIPPAAQVLDLVLRLGAERFELGNRAGTIKPCRRF